MLEIEGIRYQFDPLESVTSNPPLRSVCHINPIISMKTTPFCMSHVTRTGAIIISALGLGVVGAFAANPIVKVPINGDEFGKGLEIHATSGSKKLPRSKGYSYEIQGTCSGTGSLVNLIPPGTPVSKFINFLAPGKSKFISGFYDNPSLDREIVAIDRVFTGTKTVPSLGAVTLSAKITAGTLASGEVYFDVTNVKFSSTNAAKPGTIKFDSGAKFVISAAPEIQFKAKGQSINEGQGSINIQVTRFGNKRGVATAFYETVDGTANGDAYTMTSGKITFANNETNKIITVPILDNAVKDGYRKFTVVLSSPKKGTVLGTKVETTVGIFDND
jgi:hypothetical protein